MTVSNEQRSSRKRRTSTPATTASNTDGLRAQGLRTRNTIIRVARKLLLDGGPLEFSQRAVAAAAGISVSNLQYYFPTRIAVLRAVIEPVVIVTYLDDLKRALSSDASPRDVFEEIMQRSISDAKNAKYNALFRHLLSFAAADSECFKLYDEWYTALTHDLAQLLRAVNPAFSAADSRHAATMLIALADGLAMQYGTGRQTQALDAYFIATSRAIAYGTLVAPAGK